MTSTPTRAVYHDDGPPEPPPPPPKDLLRVRMADHLTDPAETLYPLLAASGRPVAYADDVGLWLLGRPDLIPEPDQPADRAGRHQAPEPLLPDPLGREHR